MQFLTHYWWLLVLPVAVIVWGQSMRRHTRTQWVWILRIVGVLLVLGPGIWLVTGDVESQYVSMHMGRGGVVLPIVLGIVALVGAHRLATRAGPPA